MAYGIGGQGSLDTASQAFSLGTAIFNFLGKNIKRAKGTALEEKQKLNLTGDVDISKYYKEPKDLSEQLIPDIDAPKGFVQRSRKPSTAPLSQANLLAGITNQRLATKLQNLINMKVHTDSNITKLLAKTGATPVASLKLSAPVTKVGSLKPKQSLKV